MILQLHKLLEFFDLVNPHSKSEWYFKSSVPKSLPKKRFSNDTVDKYAKAHPNGLGNLLAESIHVCNAEIASVSSR